MSNEVREVKLRMLAVSNKKLSDTITSNNNQRLIEMVRSPDSGRYS